MSRPTPQTLILDADRYDLARAAQVAVDAGLPGAPYIRRADQGGVCLSVRIDLIACPGCGRMLRRVIGPRKLWRCGSAECRCTWRLAIVHEPGGAEALALVMETF